MSNFAAAASALKACTDQLNVQTHNIASENNPGFKEELAVTGSLAYTHVKGVGSIAGADGNFVPAGVYMGNGVETIGVVSKHTQGAPVKTGNPHHLCITGPDARDYFVIELPSGETAYTRDGTFTLSPTRELITLTGGIVSPGITIPDTATNLTITPDGKVTAEVAGVYQDLGTIELATFNNPDGLKKIENNLSLETEASGTPINRVPGQNGAGTVLQGHYEAANVDPVTAVTNLVMIQRQYEMAVKAHKTGEEMEAKMDRIGA